MRLYLGTKNIEPEVNFIPQVYTCRSYNLKNVNELDFDSTNG